MMGLAGGPGFIAGAVAGIGRLFDSQARWYPEARRADKRLIKSIARALHGRLAKGPRRLAFVYISLWSWISRGLLPVSLQRRVRNSICSNGHDWPAMDFAPRRVLLGARTEVALVPHWNEFDQEALFLNALEYEAPVLRWLEANVAQTYDLILEIGANAGLYTVFFDALFNADPSPHGRRIVSFEPAPEAYRRLIVNMAANDVRHVVAYQAAVDESSGLRVFHEPVGHLTNGSLLREFSEIFAGQINETVVIAVAASELERWVSEANHTLFKIDVEGFEPELLGALNPVLQRHRPDLLIEVLPFTVDKLNADPVLMGYDKYLIRSEGLEKAAAFHVSPGHRDWLLRWPSSTVPSEDGS
jgi:FkbM family methyltransferase